MGNNKRNNKDTVPTMLSSHEAYDLVMNWLNDPLMDTAGRATKKSIKEYILYLERRVSLLEGRPFDA